MNRLLIAIISALTLGIAVPAVAGTDPQANQPAQMERQAGTDAASAPIAGRPRKCPPDSLVLPLDHGPRAQSTPYLNQQRKDRYDAQVRACNQASK